VQAHRAAIDELLSEHSHGWTLDRMPGVDRNILRIGAYELLWSTSVPEAVAISEAVVLATDLSTDASPAFVNGLLASLLERKPTLVSDEAREEGLLSAVTGKVGTWGSQARQTTPAVTSCISTWTRSTRASRSGIARRSPASRLSSATLAAAA
jgi:NusB family